MSSERPSAESVTPIEALPVPDQWDRHRANNPRHTATVTDRKPPYSIFCNDCLWHDYGPPTEGLMRKFVPDVTDSQEGGSTRHESNEQPPQPVSELPQVPGVRQEVSHSDRRQPRHGVDGVPLVRMGEHDRHSVIAPTPGADGSEA